MNNSQIPSTYPGYQDTGMQEEIQRGFITRVYGWMTVGLLITAAAAMVVLSSPTLMNAIVSNPIIFFGLIIGELIMVGVLSGLVSRMNSMVASWIFMGYAALNGITLSFIFLIYTSSSIAITFGITASTFGIMTLWGFTTHRDLTKLGSLLFMALIGLVLASLANLFFNNSAIYWITTYLGILIFVGLIAYDTQRLKRMALGVGTEGGASQKASILGALALYLDFINLFLMLLRIFGRRR